MPLVAVNIWPTLAVPEMPGSAVFVGGMAAAPTISGRFWIATSPGRPSKSKRLLPPPESVASHVPLLARKTPASTARSLS